MASHDGLHDQRAPLCLELKVPVLRSDEIEFESVEFGLVGLLQPFSEPTQVIFRIMQVLEGVQEDVEVSGRLRRIALGGPENHSRIVFSELGRLVESGQVIGHDFGKNGLYRFSVPRESHWDSVRDCARISGNRAFLKGLGLSNPSFDGSLSSNRDLRDKESFGAT